MAARLYSEILWQEDNISGTTVTSAVVPTGYIWVVRDITIDCAGLIIGMKAPPTLFELVGGGFVARVGSDPWDPVSDFNHWEGRQVLNTGEQLQAVVTGVNVYWRVSGYALTTP